MSRKEEIISALVQVRKGIMDEAASLPSHRQGKIFLGQWSIKDLLAHLIGWDYTNIEAVKEILEGKLPRFYAYYDRDWATYNAKLVTEYKNEDFRDLLASVESSHSELIRFLESVPAEAFDRDHGVRWRGHAVTVGNLLQAEIDDEKKHLEQIKRRLTA